MRFVTFALLGVGCPALAACSTRAATRPQSDAGAALSACGSQTAFACPSSPPSYVADVVPIIDSKCDNAGCHDGSGVAWPLTTYEDVQAWSDVIAYDVQQCYMPPTDGGSALDNQERSLLLKWIACGAQEPD